MKLPGDKGVQAPALNTKGVGGMKNSPVLLKPVLKSMLWGGDLLYERFGKGGPGKSTGESWELSAHENGSSVVGSGEYAGMDFGRYLGLVFNNRFDRFPLLAKLIGPAMDLSVQVHPGDGYRGLAGHESGKSEAWYVLFAPPGGRIVCGLNCGRARFSGALREGRVEECLNYIQVSAGDVIEIRPGLVHALCAGVVVYELQQNADVTYRLYDWNRVDAATGEPRQLHIGNAMDVIDFSLQAEPIRVKGHAGRRMLVQNDKFRLERIIIDGMFADSDGGFGAYTVLSGSGFAAEGGRLLFELKSGDTFFAPVCRGWEAHGSMQVLKAGCTENLR